MSAEMTGLIIKLEAQTRQLQRDFARANAIQAKASRQMETKAKQSADKIAKTYEGMGGRVAEAFNTVALPKMAGMAGTLAGIGVVGAAATVRQTVQGIAEIGDAAKRAGMQAEAFQEWSYVADQNRISVDALTDGFKELSLRADEFIITGAGSAAEAFKRLGFNAADLSDKLKDPSALMVDIIKRMEGMSKAAQVRIADEVFGGTGGEQFVQLLDKGAESIQAQIARARDLGLVMDSAMIEKAAELDAKFREVETRLRTMWRTGVVEAGYFFGLVERERAKLDFDPLDTARLLGQGTADSLATLPEVPQDALAEVEGLKQEYAALADEARALVPALSDASMMLRGVGNEAGASALTDLAARIGEAASSFEDGTLTGEEYAGQLRAVMAEADATLSAMGDLDKARLSGVIGQVTSLLDWIGKLPAAARAARAEVASLALMDTGTGLAPDDPNLLPPEPVSPLAPKVSLRPRSAPPMLGEPELPSRGAGKGGADSFGAAVERIQAETRALEAEAAALIATAAAGKGYGNALQYAKTRAELLTQAQQAGKAVTPELIAQIDQLAQAHVAAGQKAEQAADRIEAIQDASKKGAETLAGMFTSILTGAETAEEALGRLLLQILEVQLQKQLVGMFEGAGGFVGFVGGLLGFSEGGYTGKGGKFQPAGVVHAGEYVFSAETVNRLGVGNLDRLHTSAKRGYASGGLVGDSGKIALASGGRDAMTAQTSAPTITVNAPVTVNGGGGSYEQNTDLAKRVAQEMDSTIRRIMADELRKQTRPGNMLRMGR